MGEAVVVLAFLTLRVLLVGGIFLVLPRITRRGLLFGVYVGEAFVDRDVARRLLRGWYRGCALLMALALLVGYGIGLAGWPVAGNFTGTAVLLLGGLGLYLRMYYAARKLAPPEAIDQAAQATAPLLGGASEGNGLASLVLGLCVLISVATLAYAIVRYEGVWLDSSFVAMVFVPSLNLLLSTFLALIALLTAGAKRSVRGGSGGRSLEAQNAFRATSARLLSWTALLFCLFLALFSVQIVRLRLGEIETLGAGVWLMTGFLIVFLLFNLIRIMARYGQGGALIESGTAEAPLTNGLADNAHWVWGLFFVDRDDPSIMVEKRFGFGYTFNYGNRTALLIVTLFSVLFLGLAAVGLAAVLI